VPTPGELEVFRHSLKSIVEEMGVTLQRTAYSTNIKIRRDHTCALFDPDGRHLSQHDVAPQHIGTLVSMVPETIEAYGRAASQQRTPSFKTTNARNFPRRRPPR
jgi:N-methylhydantoinase B